MKLTTQEIIQVLEEERKFYGRPLKKREQKKAVEEALKKKEKYGASSTN